MKFFVYGNKCAVFTALEEYQKTAHDKDNEFVFKIIEFDAEAEDIECWTANDIAELKSSDALITWGTWGSTHRKRQWNARGTKFNQGLKEVVNQSAIALAKAFNIPHLVAETATLSRARMNHVSVPSFKSLRPTYYRLGAVHWTSKKGRWVSPNWLQQDQLAVLNESMEKFYKTRIDFENHEWRNNKSNAGRIWILPGLEQDPTSTQPVLEWVEESVKKLRRMSKRRIIIRPHPLSDLNFDRISQNYSKVRVQERLQNDLLSNHYAGMYCAVTDSSTSVFELINAGIPVFTTGDGFGASLGNTDLTRVTKINYASKSEVYDWYRKMSVTEFPLPDWSNGDIIQIMHLLVEKEKRWLRITR